MYIFAQIPFNLFIIQEQELGRKLPLLRRKGIFTTQSSVESSPVNKSEPLSPKLNCTGNEL